MRRAKPPTNKARTSNTWAAYQCYGDPDWVFRQKAEDPNQASAPMLDDFTGIASATSLRFALERIIVQTKFQGADPVNTTREPHQTGRALH